MKKVWIAVVVFLCLATVGGYCVVDHIFPKAGPISCPDTESVVSIVLSQKDDTFAPVAIFEYEWILQEIREAEPTRIMSVNDYPAVKEYYVINIVSTTRSYRYFIYIDDSQVYVELPYEGIYKANQQFYDRIVSHATILL